MSSDSENQLWDSYNYLLLSGDTSRLRKLFARYEMFKLSAEVPGDIVECGVFKGAGWMFWLKLLYIFSHGEQKKVVGFDTFSSFSGNLLEYEASAAKEFVAEADFQGVDENVLLEFASEAGFENGELVSGEVEKTIPQYAKDNPGFRISLLNLDFDTYGGTKTALENFYPHISPGGIIVLDEYGKRGWGESDAVDEFLETRNLEIRSIRHSDQPTAYIRKLADHCD